MRRQFILAIFVVSSLFAGIYGAHRWHAARQVAQRAMNRQSVVTVSAATVGRARILPRTAVVGEIVAAQGAELSLQSSGVIRRVAFHSGQRVRAGALLLRIDAGALPGQLQAAQAKAALASENFGRAQRVHAIHGISTAALDRAKYEALASAARVTALAELIQSDVSTASRQVSHLDSLGFLERVADPDDGRAHLVQLTESGRAVLRALDAHRGQIFGELLAGWSQEDATSLVGQLARLVSDIDTYRTALAHQR